MGLWNGKPIQGSLKGNTMEHVFIRHATETLCFYNNMDNLDRQGIVKDELERLMLSVSRKIAYGDSNCIGPNGEMEFKFKFPVYIKIGIVRDGIHFKFTAQASAEGNWE